MVIWKFPLAVTDVQKIDMPAGAQVLAVQVQYGKICVWAVVDPHAAIVQRTFHVIETGNPIPDGSWADWYLGTIQMPGPGPGGSMGLVWHVFDAGDP